MSDNRTTERVDHPPRVREAIDELMREKEANDNRTTELLREAEREIVILRDKLRIANATGVKTCMRCGTFLSDELLCTECAATLGNGTLTAEQVREAIERHSVWVIGNNRCFHDGAYEEITNELNSRAERNVASFCTNVKTCTLEDVLREFTEKYQYCIFDNERSITLAEYADEIRELLGVGE